MMKSNRNISLNSNRNISTNSNRNISLKENGEGDNIPLSLREIEKPLEKIEVITTEKNGKTPYSNKPEQREVGPIGKYSLKLEKAKLEIDEPPKEKNPNTISESEIVLQKDDNKQPESKGVLMSILLLLALSVHSFFEGLAIGVTDNAVSRMNLFVAIM